MQALQDAAQWLRVTLSSIGDGVITTDVDGLVTMLNPVAARLTGWTEEDAVGLPLERVFRILNQETRAEVPNPALRALREGVIVGLANHTILISRNGTERNIDDSAAPIKSETDEVAGAVLIFRDISERYRQDRLIKDAHDYCLNIFETQRESFLVLDKGMRVVTGNRAFYETFGVDRQKTEGQYVYDLGDGQWNIPKLRKLLEEILPQSGQPFQDFEVEHDFEGIGRKVMLLNARRVRRPGNHSELILLAIEDITQRRGAETAHAAISAQLATELAATQWLQEMSARLIEPGEIEGLFGHIVEAAAGIMRSDMSSMQMLDTERNALRLLAHHGFGPEFGARFEWVEERSGSSCALAMRTGRRVVVPDITTFDGVAGTASCEAQAAAGIRATQSTPLFTRSGRLLGMISTHWRTPHEPQERDLFRLDILARQAADLIERSQSDSAVRGSEMRYRRLFQAAKDGILILDAQSGTIVDANAFMSALVGLRPEDLLGKELHDIGMFKDAEESKEAFRKLQRERYLRYEHLPMRDQDGRNVEVEVVANIYSEGDTLVAQCNVRDISERIALQRKITEQAEALAQESRRKDEFLAMLSHELRNPLAPIRAAVHILRVNERGGENAIQKQAREIIERQVANMTKLVSDLLEVSRVVTGRIRLELQAVDLRQVLEHAIQTASSQFLQRGHTLTLHPCGDIVWVHADATRLEEVFVNLLNNAAKYTLDGGKIDVWCEHPRGANQAQVRIRDTGVGIEPELLHGGRLFDLFTQADRSLARSAGGLGIGLSLAHRLVDLHGGTIKALSPPDGLEIGSEFIVRLPLMPVAEQQIVPGPSDEMKASPDGVRVLIVDDNIDLVLMLASGLRHVGYGVQSAYTGPDGLKVAQQWRPDVIVLDIGLPGLDGYEVARRLRADPRTKDIRIIAATGYGREVDLALAQAAGFDAHLVKPLDFEDLERAVASAAASKKYPARPVVEAEQA